MPKENRQHLSQSISLIKQMLAFMTANQMTEETNSDVLMRQIIVCDSLPAALEETEFVQESIQENYEVKKGLFDQIDQILHPDILVASSSSGLLISELQKGRKYPHRFIIGHPYNPPHLIPLVEVIPGPMTNEAAIERTKAFYERLGMDVVLVRKEVPGHIANRLAAALWREVIDLVDNDVASVEDIDKVIRSGPGPRWALMGQLLTYHLGGGDGGIKHFIDHFTPAFESWWPTLGSWNQMPATAEQKIIQGIEEMVKDKSYEEMVAWRDETLVRLLKVLRKENLAIK